MRRMAVSVGLGAYHFRFCRGLRRVVPRFAKRRPEINVICALDALKNGIHLQFKPLFFSWRCLMSRQQMVGKPSVLRATDLRAACATILPR